MLGSDAPPAETPLVLVGREGRRRVVTAADAAACALGLRTGMAATQAQALVAGLASLDADPAGDAAALEQLALWALRRYAPVVAADPPDGLMIDVTGAAHLKGGEAALLADLVERLTAIGVAARAAIAPTYGAAHALARTVAHPTLTVGDALASALTPLPVAVLRLPVDIVDGLRRLGFDTVGELAAAPRSSLALRFGPEPGRRLDQAFGRVDEPIQPMTAPELIRVERRHTEPIGAPETIARYIGILVDQLCMALEERALGARKLDLLSTASTTASRQSGSARPNRCAKSSV